MDALQKVYAFYESCGGEKRVIGRSVCGQPIVALFVGEKGYPQLIVQYAIHAREWVTALLAPEHIRRGVPRGGCWFLPCTNPDGAALALRGEAFLQTLPREWAESLRRIGGGGFRLWKANANAVDLNVNFDADWGRGVQNVRAPAPENYIRVFAAGKHQILLLSKFIPLCDGPVYLYTCFFLNHFPERHIFIIH